MASHSPRVDYLESCAAKCCITTAEGWQEFFNYNHKMGRASASYHHVLHRWWAAPFLRFPMLTFLAPIVILPSIALSLARSRWSYLLPLPPVVADVSCRKSDLGQRIPPAGARPEGQAPEDP